MSPHGVAGLGKGITIACAPRLAWRHLAQQRGSRRNGNRPSKFGMPVWKLATAALMVALLLSGCARDDPQAALVAAAKALQENIENKDTAALLAQIHPEFRANQVLDREWVRRTATLMFLRHRNVKVLALSSDSWLDPSYADKGRSEAQVALTGAQGLLPQSAGHYHVRLEWWLEDGDWLLARLDWE